MTIPGLRMDAASSDSRRLQITRAALGAFYGFLGGVTFVFVAAFVDIWLYRDLPLGVDWQTLRQRLPLFSLGLALVGAVTCWWTDGWPGILSGAATGSALALIVALSTGTDVGTGMKFLVLVFILVPIAAMLVPITWILRWFVERHLRAWYSNWRYGRVVALIALALSLGAAGGFFMKMPARELAGTRYVHQLLQGTLDETTPIGKVQGIAEHWGSPYQLYSMASETSTVGYDVRARFEDGYTVECTAVLYVGRPPLISGCTSE